MTSLIILTYNPGKNILEQINNVNPLKNVVSVCRETSTLLQELRGFFIKTLRPIILSNPVQTFWPEL